MILSDARCAREYLDALMRDDVALRASIADLVRDESGRHDRALSAACM